ncbi:hypothetical protein EK904_015193 [Melospiza melodia maxima]|nr:hypothetical protein EK904_015193 [Melospiza melodia maxima]
MPAAGTAVLGTLDDVMMSPVSFSQLGIPSIPHPAQSHTSFHSFRLPGILQQSLQLPFPQGCGKHNNLVRYKGKIKPCGSRRVCWSLSWEDFNSNPAVSYQLMRGILPQPALDFPGASRQRNPCSKEGVPGGSSKARPSGHWCRASLRTKSSQNAPAQAARHCCWQLLAFAPRTNPPPLALGVCLAGQGSQARLLSPARG